MTIAAFYSFWPLSRVVTAQMMNFSVVGTVGVIVVSLIYYVLRARNVHDGPIVEID